MSVLSQETKLFRCHECSISCSKHFAPDSLHVVLDVVRHSEVDCNVFDDASLIVVQSETYLTKVIKFLVVFLCITVLFVNDSC